MVENAYRPVIGVTMSRRKSRIARFFDWLAIRRAGGRVRFLKPGVDLATARLDGLVVGGGDDIGADIYGGEVVPDIRIDPERDAMELKLLEEAEARALPVLGICRGAQMMNVFLGGNLYSDIRDMPREKTAMRTVLARKAVTIRKGSAVHRILGTEAINVNSLHHQAMDRLGREIEVSGRDRGDFVQAMERRGERFFIGVQWHPEFLVFDRRHQNLFSALVCAATWYRKNSAGDAT